MNSHKEKFTQTQWVIGAVAILVIALVVWLWASGTGISTPATTSPTGTNGTETSGTGQVNIVNSSATTVAGILSTIPNAGRFNQLLAQTGVATTLTGKGPFTVFVATDGAFSRLVPGTINNQTPTELKRTMQYHVVSGKTLDIDAVNSGQIQALSKDPLNFQVDATKGAVYVNSGSVLKAYKVKNGIVYVINSVLLPPKQ